MWSESVVYWVTLILDTITLSMFFSWTFLGKCCLDNSRKWKKGITIFDDPKRSKVNEAFLLSNKLLWLKFNSWIYVLLKPNLFIFLDTKKCSVDLWPFGITVVLVIFATWVKRKLKFVLVWLSCGQTTSIGKPLCCLYTHAKLPTNWINRFLPYERVAKITKITVSKTVIPFFHWALQMFLDTFRNVPWTF